MKGFRLSRNVPMALRGARSVFMSKDIRYLLRTMGKTWHASPLFGDKDYSRQTSKRGLPGEISVAG